ncbi:MAG: orotate phosphoribosyltransferase [Thermodesulfobacteria bacterium]|nr:orotate phosphoribosyltransferase [Thermodesulfobacteriota bacterium]
MEKRKFTRIDFSTSAEFVWNDKKYPARIKDVSYGGVFLYSDVIPNKKAEIPIYLSIDGTEPPIKIFFKGKVVRTEPGKGFAVVFTYISPESFGHLKKFIFYNLGSEEEAEKELMRFLGEAYPLIQGIKLLNIKIYKEMLLNYILERAFIYSPENPIVLSSGRTSPYYIDCRKITLFSESFDIVGELFWQEVKYLGVDAVAGMSLGADPIVGAVLAKAAEENYPLEGLLVRKEPKSHGTRRQIEGNVRDGMMGVVVEDVVTTGGSVLKAVKALEQEGVNVLKIIALVDREEGGREAIEEKGYQFQAFFTLKEIVDAYTSKKEG